MGRVALYDGPLAKYKTISDPGKVLLGYEYEIDPQSNDNQNECFDTKILDEHFNWTWESLMHPVSGWELKSMITSLSKHRPVIDTLLQVTKFNTKPNGRDTNAGGIHVNISKDDYTKRVVSKPLFYLNNEKNYDHLLKLSHRDPFTFRTYCPQFKYDSVKHAEKSYRKYTTLAMHKKYAYELRLFAAHPDILKGSLEYADALFVHANDVDSITTDSLYQFCSNSPDHTEAARLINAAR